MKLNFISKGYFKTIDEFMLIKQIGVGSFGKVQLALHTDTNKFYAIKVVKLQGQDLDEKELRLLERQVYLHSDVDHPHIVKLWDTITSEKSVYLIMELAQNSSLFTYQNKKKILSQPEAFKYFNQTLKAVQYLHSRNIMHRDIKPQNILLDKNFNVKLCDLGWATQEIHQKRKTFCGTYEYMAPEMVFQKQYCYKIDVWAIGVLLYELLHGYAPFKARSLEQIKQKISKGYYQINNSFSKELKTLIIDLLNFDPESRPQLSEVKNYRWVQRMIKQIREQGLKITQQLSAKDEPSQKKSQIKRQKILASESKKHKRIQSMQNDFNPIKSNESHIESKSGNNAFKKMSENQSEQNIKKMKKKCKTQSEQSLQKYQTELLKPIISNKLLNASSILKKRTEKENINLLKAHLPKWSSNLVDFNLIKTDTESTTALVSKTNKLSEKIIQAPQKSQKTEKKKMRLKTYNFF